MTSLIKILDWDTRIFGRRMSRFTKPHLTPALARSAETICRKKRVDCLYFLAASEDSSSVRCAEDHGFHLADIRVTLSTEMNSTNAFVVGFLPQGMTYRSARPTDIRPLQHLARNMFPNSRFAVDPSFPPDAHEKLFSLWIAKSVRRRFDDWVGVAEVRERLAGFVSCRRTGRSTGMIGLIGVAPAFRRRGIARGLLNYAFEWFRAHRIRRVSVVTQGRAVGAQRLYQECGFKTSQVDLWYHKWF